MRQTALLCGFSDISAVGISYALLGSKALITDRMENRHEIRNLDAQQFLCRMCSDLRIHAGRHVGVNRCVVQGYDRFGHPAPYHPQNAGTAWGLYASTEDMAKYIRWQLDDGDPVVHLSHQVLMGDADDGEAMAWNVGNDHGQPIIWHGGGSFGMSSQVLLYPKQHEGFVLLANDTCTGTESALKAIGAAVEAK